MGRIVVSEFLSLDGVMEAPGGEPGFVHSGWVGRFPDQGQYAYKLAEVQDHEALLIGRVTYDSFAAAWPEREGVFADRMNAMPKFVVSTTLRDPRWENMTVVDRDVVAAIGRLRTEVPGDLLVAGSGTLVGFLRGRPASTSTGSWSSPSCSAVVGASSAVQPTRWRSSSPTSSSSVRAR